MNELEFDPTRYLDPAAPVSATVGLTLWFAAAALAERADRSVMSVAGGLPPIAKLWVDHPAWAQKLAGCYRMVRDRLAIGVTPIARCTGEEFALHMTIAAATELTLTGMGPDPADHGMQLMAEPTLDDFANAHSRLFEDDDLLMLFEPVLDGIEDASSADNQRYGVGPYLHPSRWFDPFPGYDRAGPLEPVVTVEAADNDVIIAANVLAVSVGARGTVSVLQDGDRWLARARYPGRELVGEGDGPESAATALAHLILEGAHCPACGRTVTTNAGGPLTSCVWHRQGRTWMAGCRDET